MNYVATDYRNDYLEHYGVPGMKWNVRNYQYYDGSLTPEGRLHYGVGPARVENRTKVLTKGSRLRGHVAVAANRLAGNKKQANIYKAELKRDKALRKAYEKAKAADDNVRKIKNNPKKVLKNLDMFTNEELKQIHEREQLKQQIHEDRVKKFQRGADIAKGIVQYLDAASNMSKDVKNIYDNVHDLKGMMKKSKEEKNNKTEETSKQNQNSKEQVKKSEPSKDTKETKKQDFYKSTKPAFKDEPSETPKVNKQELSKKADDLVAKLDKEMRDSINSKSNLSKVDQYYQNKANAYEGVRRDKEVMDKINSANKIRSTDDYYSKKAEALKKQEQEKYERLLEESERLRKQRGSNWSSSRSKNTYTWR